MIKNTLIVVCCLGVPFMLKAKAKVEQDTSQINITMSDTSTTNGDVYDAIPTVTLEDVETNDEGSSDQAISPVLNAGRDAFLSAASFNFSIARFRIRGYDNSYFETYMNGVPTEYIDNGYGAYTLWSGLNDVTRSRENVLGLRPSSFAFSDIGGLYAIDTRAGKQRKQLSVTIGTSNRTYDLRGGVTYGSGLTKKGWSVAVSLFGRWAKNGYVKGTSMQSISYFLSVQKFFKKQSLALTVFGVPTKQGKASSTTQEAMDLAGSHYYNPNWGYQDGKIRNSRVEYRHQPTFILTHEWQPTNNSNLTTAAGYSFGERSLSMFDRNQNIDDPRPDYYKHLPSYYNDSAQAGVQQELYNMLKANPSLMQVNWDKIYDVNRSQPNTTVNNVDGTSNSKTGKNSLYILGDDVKFYHRFNFNSVYNVTVKEFDITAGLQYQFQKVNNYKRVRDLLGGDYYLDQNSFTQDSVSTNVNVTYPNLNQPNHVVTVGDKYGYNYSSLVHKTALWGQVSHHLKHIDWFVGIRYSNTTQWREGIYKNGLDANSSQGKSKIFSYNNYTVKGGLTYKIDGRNYLYANGSYETRAPFWDNIFISPRVRNLAQNPGSERIGSFEGGYIYNAPRVKLRATGFYTNFQNGSDVLVYFDDDYFGLASYTLTNINKVHFGGEFGTEVQVYKGISISLAASVGKYYYTSRQQGVLTIDNQPDVMQKETVYSKNFYVPNIPQQAYTLGLSYRSKKFWYVGANVNFFDRFYTEYAPTHRTARAVDLVPYPSDQWNSIINQQRYNKKGQWTLDLSGGYSWRLKSTFRNMKGKNAGKYYLVLNAGISNVTNNKKFIVNAREQLRFDYAEKNPDKFPTKFSYAYGTNFFLNITFRY
ncbi:MAG: TonB-dependent receptor [Chitinophagales bacterium]